MMRKITFYLLAMLLLSACSQREKDVVQNRPYYLEHFSDERQNAIIAQASSTMDTVVGNDCKTQECIEKLEDLYDTLLYVVEHGDSPNFTGATRSLSTYVGLSLLENGFDKNMAFKFIDISYHWSVKYLNKDSISMYLMVSADDEQKTTCMFMIEYLHSKNGQPVLVVCPPADIQDWDSFKITFFDSYKRLVGSLNKENAIDDYSDIALIYNIEDFLDLVSDSEFMITGYDNGSVMHHLSTFKKMYLSKLKEYSKL